MPIQAAVLPQSLPAPRPADSLGCSQSSLSLDRELVAGELRLYRKRHDSRQLGHVATDGSDRGHLFGLSLAPGHRRRVLGGRAARTCEFQRGAYYLRDFSADYRADICSGFDFLLIEFPPQFFERIGGGQPDCSLLRQDDVLTHLAQALLPALDRPRPDEALFVEQLGIAIGLRLARPGRAPAPAAPARLSRSQLATATELLLTGGGATSIAAVAEACALSRAHFIRAFRHSLGQTPHRWLLQQRVERARGLLAASDRSLAEIAAEAGFADQSHFTRVFARATGCTPGAWRRAARG
ncbi:AraC family transcriptional regulator [Derxia lacustris]|uniref:AraC family transcriptional regulator n=1 Tax=Derxia lacustris TaxID=764842 RepID=UPI000A172C49|nr:helix-turn-helix transcriptional regulator [Derxia lacustris]